jgi:hypothetical protein
MNTYICLSATAMNGPYTSSQYQNKITKEKDSSVKNQKTIKSVLEFIKKHLALRSQIWAK